MKKIFSFGLIATIALMMASCGEEPSINPNAKAGRLPGKFSVSATEVAYFSQGNLQYNAKQDKWRFAEHQWDTIATNDQIGKEDYEGWISLFGWGTGANPTNTSTNNSDYPSFNEWGANEISNGGNAPNRWFTLSKDQWTYLFHSRENAEALYGYCNIDGINGVVLLPDGWFDDPDAPAPFNRTSYIYTTITQEDWATNLEPFGAVFLPAEGFRSGTSVIYSNRSWFYWSSDEYDENKAYNNSCKTSDDLTYVNVYWPKLDGKFYGSSVRLVQYENKVVPEGAIKAGFAVSDNKQVFFSQGNLLLNPSSGSGVWSFAEHQWDIYGDNANIIDLFSWDYILDSPDWINWTTKAIQNGGKGTTTWRALTKDEWNYLLFDRSNASDRKAYGQIEVSQGKFITGLILLPEGWKAPTDVPAFTPGFTNIFATNEYTLNQWEKMDAAGALFLPAAGYNNTGTGNTAMYSLGVGYYVSSTPLSSDDITLMRYSLYDTPFISDDGSYTRAFFHSVRLVTDAK